jgi:Mce-associated membrane protein
MPKLKRDERICPYCAETIKASAIRCRFCQSDVTPVIEPEAQPTAEAKPKTKPVPPAVPEPAAVESDGAEEAEEAEDEGTSAPSRTPLHKRLTLVLAVLVALAGAGVGTLWWRADHGTAAAAPSGTLVADDARTEVLISAADLAQRTLSYDYRTLANDMETARARMTPAFRKQYDATMAQIRANTTKNEIVLQAVAVSSAIINATEHKAKVLVFLNQTTTAGTGKKANQQASRNSLVINLTRGDGDWAISKLTSLG